MRAQDDTGAHIVRCVDRIECLNGEQPSTVRDGPTRRGGPLCRDRERDAFGLTVTYDRSDLLRTSRNDEALGVAVRVRGVGQVPGDHIGIGDGGQVEHSLSLFRDHRHGRVCQTFV